MSLVVVGAHALDSELMAGPLAAIASGAGWPVALIHLTLGERGHPEKPPEVFAPQLREETLRAARALGVEAVWSGAPAPLRGVDVFDWLVAELDGRRPTVVVTHWSGSWHASHREASDVVRRALSALGSRPTLAFGENCEDLVGFVPRISSRSPLSANGGSRRQASTSSSGARSPDRESTPPSRTGRTTPRRSGCTVSTSTPARPRCS